MRLITLSILALALSVTSAQAQSNLTASQLKKVMPNFKGLGPGFSVDYSPTGSVEMQEGATRYSGKWWLKGNTVCNSFKHLHNGKKTCRTVKKVDARDYRFTRTDNGRAYTIRVK